MLRRKKEVKRVLIAGFLLVSILLTSIQIYSIFNPVLGGDQNNTLLIEDENELFASDDPYLSTYFINGSGVEQDVRIYGQNSSSSDVNNQNSFDIPAMSTIDTSYLSYGEFNFTFQNNYTTEYIIENSSALYPNDFIQFEFDDSISTMNVDTGVNLTNLELSRVTDNNNNTFIKT